MADRQFVEVDGYALEYRVARPSATAAPAVADQVTVVMLHEGLGCVEMWGDFPGQVAAHLGLPVLVYSRAGYGRSDRVPPPWPLDFMERQARRSLPVLLERLNIGEHVLLGHSDGGSIALIYAGSPELASRARLRGLAVMAAHAFNEPVCMAGIAAAERSFIEGRLRAGLARFHGARVGEVFRGWHDVWRDPAFEHWSIERFLPRIEAPALVLQGRHDPYGTRRQVDTIVGQVNGPVEAEVLDDCGHSPHRDATDRVLARLGDFTARIKGQA